MNLEPDEALLVVSQLESGYSRLQVLWKVSITISKGELVVLLGPNGAGKTTTLGTIAGLIKPRSGTVNYRGMEITGRPAHEVSRLGVRFIPEHSRLFAGMSVKDNLLLGAYTVRDPRQVWQNLDRIFDLFPQLAAKQKQMAGTLSGGEQRMLAVGRGLMGHPDLLLVDEPSLGLAPKAALAVLSTLHRLKEQGVTI